MKPSLALTVVLTAALAGTVGWFAARNTSHVATSTGESKSTARKIKFYQSPMHPWIKSDKPGKCTICGMTLAPVYEGEAGIATEAGLITLSDSSASVLNVKTSKATRAPLVRSLRVSGVLDDDETLHRLLTARVPGRVEKLFVNQVGAEVTAGQPLGTLYSPDVFTAERLYLERLKAGALATSASELADAREKLLALGLVDEDIARLEKTGKPESILTLRAPSTGTVVDRSSYEGQYVQPDTILLQIGDLSHLWFLFDAYEPDLPFLSVGQNVEVNVPSRPGETFTAPIAFINPNFNEMTRTATIRVVIPNKDRLLFHRQTATGRVLVTTADILQVPRSAVLQTGAHPVVYMDHGGHAYMPMPVKLGRVGDDSVEILSGLDEGDTVVTEGALMIDSQAQVAASANAMNHEK
jgi:membrane fusion protein, copper/silver efflux system